MRADEISFHHVCNKLPEPGPEDAAEQTLQLSHKVLVYGILHAAHESHPGQVPSAAGKTNIGPKAADGDHSGAPGQHHHDVRGRLTEGIQFKHYHSVRVLGAALPSLPWLSSTLGHIVKIQVKEIVHLKRYVAIHFHLDMILQSAWILCRQYWPVLIHH